MPHTAPSGTAFDIVFLILQGAVTAFLLLHDWVPLGRLNNLGAIRREDSLARSIFVTLLPAVPAGIILFYCSRYRGQSYPHWLDMTILITYGFFLIGLLQAWWIPYLLIPNKERAARYQVIFAGTHTFLPKRNGMAPDTLHTLFHICCLGVIVMYFLRGRLIS